MIDMFSLILGFVLGAVSVIVGFLLPTSRRTKRAVDGATELRLNDCEVDPEKLPGKYADE